MKIIIRMLMVLLSIGMTSCHIFVTGPLLWNHHTSTALELFCGIWAICGAICYAWVVPINFGKGKS